ncbi:MAG: 50S ribosomal protein L27 [Candidatus Saccharibacteria bacterium]
MHCSRIISTNQEVACHTSKPAVPPKILGDSQGQRLGVKLFGGQVVRTGQVIVRQVGMSKRPGVGTTLSRNFTNPRCPRRRRPHADPQSPHLLRAAASAAPKSPSNNTFRQQKTARLERFFISISILA